MKIVHFIEENTVVLCQLLNQLPSENDAIKIKGRKGKVLTVKNVENHILQVYVSLEKRVKNQPLTNDKKKRR